MIAFFFMKKQDPAYRFAAFFSYGMKNLFIAFIAISFFIVGCKDGSGANAEGSSSESVLSADRTKDSLQRSKAIQDSIQSLHRRDSVLLKLTQNILVALRNKNYSAFANYIDPVSGIRFSPYGFVDTVHHVTFSKTAFRAQAGSSEQQMLTWGEFAGTGDPIKMTLNNYMQRFVYDVDFIKPEKREVNQFIGSGNSLNNLLSVYKECHFTESHFSGFEEKYQGMDWKSLRLVFKERNKRFYLVGVVHDEWTI